MRPVKSSTAPARDFDVLHPVTQRSGLAFTSDHNRPSADDGFGVGTTNGWEPSMSEDAATRWMIERLESHLTALQKSTSEHYAEQVEGLDVSRRIIERVLPGEIFAIDPLDDEHWQWRARTVISRALGVVKNRAEILEFLGPSGPSMPADDLHPVIWNAASELWRIEHYRAAVASAATFLNAYIQVKSTRVDLSDKNLMSQVFSASEAAHDQPRLRWNGPGTAQTKNSMLQGLMAYAQGVSMTIRNPAAHETDERPRQTALEQLAALSLLARWVDDCELDKGPESFGVPLADP